MPPGGMGKPQAKEEAAPGTALPTYSGLPPSSGFGPPAEAQSNVEQQLAASPSLLRQLENHGVVGPSGHPVGRNRFKAKSRASSPNALSSVAEEPEQTGVTEDQAQAALDHSVELGNQGKLPISNPQDEEPIMPTPEDQGSTPGAGSTLRVTPYSNRWCFEEDGHLYRALSALDDHNFPKEPGPSIGLRPGCPDS